MARTQPLALDLICGNADGQVLFYKNLGSPGIPVFSSSPIPVESAGRPISLAGLSTPSVCLWPDHDMATDAYPDLLVGASDGKVHLFRGIPLTGDVNGDRTVDFKDLAVLGLSWGQAGPQRVDINGDGTVDAKDLRILATGWLYQFVPQP